MTCSALAMKHGSLSSQLMGTVACLSAYTSRSKAQGSFSSGRKVTEAVICRMIAWISCVISLGDLSDVAACAEAFPLVRSVCRHREKEVSKTALHTYIVTQLPHLSFSFCLHSTSNTHRSSVSPVSVPLMTSTNFCTLPFSSHTMERRIHVVIDRKEAITSNV